MRGIESTTKSRIYVSDNARLCTWVATKRKADPKSRITNADALRAIFDENLRQKKRIAYLNLEVLRLSSELSKVKSKVVPV